MATRTINFHTFDDEDVIGLCPLDDGPLVRRLDLAGLLDLTEDEALGLEVGTFTIGYCPVGNHVLIRTVPLPVVGEDDLIPLEP